MNITDEIKDLSSRLYYCSDTKEGRKMRKYFEKKIKQLEQALENLRRLETLAGMPE